MYADPGAGVLKMTSRQLGPVRFLVGIPLHDLDIISKAKWLEVATGTEIEGGDGGQPLHQSPLTSKSVPHRFGGGQKFWARSAQNSAPKAPF